MVSSLIIVFREMLEMALVLGILLAATKGMPGTRRWIGGGTIAGLAGAVMVALMADVIEQAAAGIGERIFNAAVLAVAATLIAWTVIWMTQHGREMAARMQYIGRSVSEGELPHTALAVVASAAVMREGSEAVLFLFGAAKAGHGDAISMLIGGSMGVVLGAAIGYAIYRGLLRIPTRYLFQVIGWLLILLAAGMASQAAGHLVKGGVLPALVQPLWDSSAWLPRSEILGQLLHVLVGYDDKPSGMQFLIFIAAFVVIVIWQRQVQAKLLHTATPPPA
ncbi:MAG: FTR1 family protein [Mariprofundaceae bacterium]